MPQNDPSLSPMKCLDDQPIFTEGWQAQVLAIAQNLVDTGAITADDWSNTLGLTLRKMQFSPETDTVDNYYKAALEALETVLQTNCGITNKAMKQRKSDWAHAYKTTPHGKPVEL